MTATKVKLVLIAFSAFLAVFSLLLAYDLALFFTDLSLNQEITLNYLKDPNKLGLNYTDLEISHLEDVRKVMDWAEGIFYLSLLAVLSTILYFYKDKFKLKKLFLWGGIIITTLVGIILLLAIVSFSSSFTIFHQIFFPQGNWQFPAESLLIQTFPFDFFVGISYLIFSLALIEGIVFILLGIYLKDGHVERN